MVLRILRVPNKYDEAITALICGCASVIFGVLVNVVWSNAACGTPVMLSAGMAVKWGRQALGQTGKAQRLLARIGITGGIVGIALYVNSLINIVGIYQRSLQPQTFKGNGLQFTYPGSWQTIDMTQIQACKQAQISCVLLVGQPDKTTISIIQSPLVYAIRVDKALVQQHVQAIFPNAHLTSQETVSVGGQPAGRVIFDAPYAAAPGGYGYFLSVEVAKDLSLYSISARAVSAEALAAHRQDIDNIISSIVFTS